MVLLASHQLFSYKDTNSVTGVLTNEDKRHSKTCCSGCREKGFRPPPGLDFGWLHSTGQEMQLIQQHCLCSCCHGCVCKSNKALCYISKAGWMGHVLLGTSSCLLQGTGMFLCVEMALLWFPSPPLLPVAGAASSPQSVLLWGACWRRQPG